MKLQKKAILFVAFIASLVTAKEDTLIATHDVSICTDNINSEYIGEKADGYLDQQTLNADAARFAVVHYTC